MSKNERWRWSEYPARLYLVMALLFLAACGDVEIDATPPVDPILPIPTESTEEEVCVLSAGQIRVEDESGNMVCEAIEGVSNITRVEYTADEVMVIEIKATEAIVITFPAGMGGVLFNPFAESTDDAYGVNGLVYVETSPTERTIERAIHTDILGTENAAYGQLLGETEVLVLNIQPVSQTFYLAPVSIAGAPESRDM